MSGRWFLTSCVGVAVLTAAAAPAAAQRTHELPRDDTRLEGEPATVFSVGTEGGADHETFSAVPSVAFDAAGSLYVLDRDNGRVLVFDRTGGFVRQIGRKGEGPGEMGLPMGMTVAADGRVVVFDLVNNAFSVFGTAGEYETLVRAPFGVRGNAGGMYAHPQGIVMAGSQLPDPEAGPGGAIRPTLPLLLVPLDGSAPRTLYEAPAPPPQVETGGSANERRVMVQPPPMFSPTVSYGVLPDGRLAVSHGTEYAVRIVANGSPAAVLTRPLAPRDVSERDRDAAREARREALLTGAGMVRMENVNGRRSASVGGGGMPPQQVEQMLANMKFAETIAVVRNLTTDREGRIWVRRAGGPGRYDEGPIDLLAADGRYIGTIQSSDLPDAFGPNGLAAWIETDELDIPRVVVRRLPADWR